METGIGPGPLLENEQKLFGDWHPMVLGARHCPNSLFRKCTRYSLVEYPVAAAMELNLARHPDPVFLKDGYRIFFTQ